MADLKTPRPGWRTWGDGTRCAHCCNGDRCDDHTHYDRTSKPGCPHCLNTGYALWTEAGYAEAEKNGRLVNVAKPGAESGGPRDG
jgi:hypothetical protein